MNDSKIKLQTIKRTCNDGTIELLCDIMLEMIDKLEPKGPVGFIPKDEEK